jgi:hypothetical protein
VVLNGRFRFFPRLEDDLELLDDDFELDLDLFLAFFFVLPSFLSSLSLDLDLDRRLPGERLFGRSFLLLPRRRLLLEE